MSRVTCHMSKNLVYIFFIEKKKMSPSEKIGKSGGASWWMVCYQQGLLRLVKKNIARLRKAALINLIGFGGVKLFLQKPF